MQTTEVNDSLLPRLIHDTDSLPVQDRFESQRQRLSSEFEVLLPEGSSPLDVKMHGSWSMMDGMLLAEGEFSPMSMHRSADKIRSSHVDHYKLHMRTSGEPLQLDAQDRRLPIAANEFALTDLSRPESVRIPAGGTILVFITRDALDEMLPAPLDLHGVMPKGVCSNLLAQHLLTLREHAPHMTRSEAQGAATATLHLLAASLAPSAKTLAQARPAVESTQLRQICKYVDLHLGDEDLAPPKLCSGFAVSRATLYRMFEPLGGVASYVRERRLARVHELLQQPEQRHYIERVAADHGFKSSSHLSRAFKEHFGYSPSEARGRSPGAAPSSTRGSDENEFTRWMRGLRS